MADLSNYFDNAAATPMLPKVLAAMQPFFSEKFYNPSAIYLAAQDVKASLDNARWLVAQNIGAKPTEIIFTAGGTEANNLAISGVMALNPGAELIVSAIEHDSVLLPAKNYKAKIANVDEKGIVDVNVLAKLVNNKTVLISVMMANNEIGVLQPIKDIVELVAKVRKERQKSGNKVPLYVHTDACQAVNYCDINISRLGVDLMTFNGGKIYGPKQSGVLFKKIGVNLQPLIYGGGQEYSLRSGTENVAQCIGFATAFEQAKSNAKSEVKRLGKIRDEAINELLKLPKIMLNGPKGSKRLANNINITVNGIDNERLLMQLDEQGFIVATGSACSASNDEPSHVLKAIGLSDKEAQSTIRITLGRSTTKDSCTLLCKTILQLVK